jgi:MFS family permease
LLVPFFNGVITLTLISFMFGLGMGCAQPITMILMFRHSPKGRSGATLGMRLTANNLMRVLGPAVFGSVGSALGLFAVFWINGLVMGAGGFLARPTNAARRVP